MSALKRRLKALEAKEKDEGMTAAGREAWDIAIGRINDLVESDNPKTREVARELVGWLKHHETTDTDLDLTTLTDAALDMLEQFQIEAGAP